MPLDRRIDVRHVATLSPTQGSARSRTVTSNTASIGGPAPKSSAVVVWPRPVGQLSQENSTGILPPPRFLEDLAPPRGPFFLLFGANWANLLEQ